MQQRSITVLMSRVRRVMQVTVAGRTVRLAGGTTSTKRWFALPLTPAEALAAADGGLVLEVGLYVDELGPQKRLSWLEVQGLT